MRDYGVVLTGPYRCLGVIRALVSPSKSVSLGTPCPMAAKAVLAEEFIVFVNDNVLYHSNNLGWQAEKGIGHVNNPTHQKGLNWPTCTRSIV